MRFAAHPAARSLGLTSSYRRPALYLSRRPSSIFVSQSSSTRIEWTQRHHPERILTRSFAHTRVFNYAKAPKPPDRGTFVDTSRTAAENESTAATAAPTVVVAGGGLTTGNNLLDALLTTAVGLVMGMLLSL